MLSYFRTLKDAFDWKQNLGLKPLAMFVLKSVLAYIFLVGLYLVGFRVVMYTPFMDYMTVDTVCEITANVLIALRIILSIPVILHVIKATARGITDCL
ncbi:Hypothetical protein AKI40_2660 [Enterobacter sp. FY-07]|nr:Hypothetical protein AKI40_2660 [Enterobacter sp. FY-07]